MSKKPTLKETAIILKKRFDERKTDNFLAWDLMSDHPLYTPEHITNLNKLVKLGALKAPHKMHYYKNGNQLDYFIKFHLTKKMICIFVISLYGLFKLLGDDISRILSIVDFFNFFN